MHEEASRMLTSSGIFLVGTIPVLTAGTSRVPKCSESESGPTTRSSLPSWAVLARVDRARGARGPLALRGADDEGRGLMGSKKQREDVLFYVWV